MGKGYMGMRDPILITGAARSGTSMTAGAVSLCGGFGGVTSPPNSNNKRGMFENQYIRTHIKKPYLRQLGVDHMGQNPLPSDAQVMGVTDEQAVKWRGRVTGALKAEGLVGDDVWYYKGAKMCLVWRMWHKAFPDAKWIIVRRNAEDIVKSCMRTGFMRAFRHPGLWVKWVEVHEKRFQEMRNAGLLIKEVWPQQMINGSFDEIQDAIEWVGLQWDGKLVREFIAPELWGGK